MFAFASFGAGAAQLVWGFWTSKAGMLVCTVVCGFCVACKGPVWSEVVMLIVGPDLFTLAAGYSMVTTGIGWMAGAPAAGIYVNILSFRMPQLLSDDSHVRMWAGYGSISFQVLG